MYIGQAAQRSGTTIKSIRHYESIGLLPTPRRQGNYRLYDQQSVELLIFIKCAKDMGFRLKELQAIFCEHHGEAMPWALAQQAIEAKKARSTAPWPNSRANTRNSKGLKSSWSEPESNARWRNSNDLRVSEQLDVEYRQLTGDRAL